MREVLVRQAVAECALDTEASRDDVGALRSVLGLAAFPYVDTDADVRRGRALQEWPLLGEVDRQLLHRGTVKLDQGTAREVSP
ncbi:hypothetical protein CDEF62S_02874 [Castellaniella defragrans]